MWGVFQQVLGQVAPAIAEHTPAAVKSGGIGNTQYTMLDDLPTLQAGSEVAVHPTLSTAAAMPPLEVTTPTWIIAVDEQDEDKSGARDKLQEQLPVPVSEYT